jgi:DNA-binding MarR family transcriptional regulator
MHQPKSRTEPLPNLLWERPGFLVRRLHQIHSAMFLEACRAFGVTPLQYSLLSILRAQPGLDQSGIGEELGLDRSNAFDVVQRLKRAGLISLVSDVKDKRRKKTILTTKGASLLAKLDPPALKAHEELLSSLSARDRALLMKLLRRVLSDVNHLG